MDPLLLRICNQLLKRHKEVCILKETADTKEEWEKVNIRAKTIRECLHQIGSCLPEQQSLALSKQLEIRLDSLKEAMYFQEIMEGVD